MTTHIPSQTQINSNTPVSIASSGWAIYLEDQGRSINTVKAFTADIKLLASYLPPDHPLGSVTTVQLNNFLSWMQNERGVPCSPKTLARRITSLKSFFRWLQKNGVVIVDPAEKVLQKSVLSPLPNVLSPSEVSTVLKIAGEKRGNIKKPDSRPFTLIKLLLDTGIKKGECLTISPNHIDLKSNQEPFLFIRYASPQYRYKERKIPLSPEWLEAYEEYKTQYDLSEKLFPWSPRRLEYLLEDIGKEAGLEYQLSFLICRWTSALLDLKNGVEPNKIRQKLGVSKIQWREVYMKLNRLSNSNGDKELG